MRQHVVVFLNGTANRDRRTQSDSVKTDSEIFIMQALSGGLFHSPDHGALWQLVESLWNHPDRAKWFGGGADWPGIHTILVDPRDPRRLLLAVSCAGIWENCDNGATWQNIGAGQRALRWRTLRHAHPRRRDDLGATSCRSAAAARLSSRLPPLSGC